MKRLSSVPRAALAAVLVATGLGSAAMSPAQEAAFRWEIDIEVARAYQATSTLRVPDGATELSLTDDLSGEDDWAGRLTVGYRVAPRHWLRAVVAPLALESEGELAQPVDFAGVTFPADTGTRGRFRSNTYRLTWLYDFDPTGDFRFGAGLTGAFRHHSVRLANEDELEAARKMNGVLPGIHLSSEARINDAWWAVLDGDALYAGEGRLWDAWIGVRRTMGDQSAIRLGYRVVEGGVDSDELHDIELVHEIAGAVVMRLE
jgi:hypothetical protein